MSWETYIKKVNQIIKDLERHGLKLGDKANAVAVISACNLDSNSKLHIESVARNLSNNKELSGKLVEEVLLRFRHETETESKNEMTTAENDETTNCNTTTDETAYWINRGGQAQRRGIKKIFLKVREDSYTKRPFLRIKNILVTVDQRITSYAIVPILQT